MNKAARTLYKRTHPEITERDIAKGADVAQQTASSWVRGVHLPTPEKRDVMEKRFGIPKGDWEVELPDTKEEIERAEAAKRKASKRKRKAPSSRRAAATR